LPHVSFSAIKDWKFCPYYHKLTRIDKIKVFEGNIYTAFGKAIHDTCEAMLLSRECDKHLDAEPFSRKLLKTSLLPLMKSLMRKRLQTLSHKGSPLFLKSYLHSTNISEILD